MMLSEREAATIAVKKAVEILGSRDVHGYSYSHGNFNGVHELTLYEPYAETAPSGNLPSIDESKPWKKVIIIRVNLRTAETTVDIRENVSIFD